MVISSVWPQGAKTVTMTAIIADADALNATNSAEYGVEISTDNEATWNLLASFTWQGGADPRYGGPQYPSLSASSSDTSITHARPKISPNGIFSLDATLQFS